MSYTETGLLANNSFITADSNGMIDDLDCSSDSTMAGIGRWIAPNSADATNSTADPFDVIIGDKQDAGSLVVRLHHGHIITKSFEGIYTCIMPRADGTQTYHLLGIYQNGFNSKKLGEQELIPPPSALLLLQWGPALPLIFRERFFSNEIWQKEYIGVGVHREGSIKGAKGQGGGGGGELLS